MAGASQSKFIKINPETFLLEDVHQGPNAASLELLMLV